MTSFHQLTGTERDTLYAAATADASVGDRPHKSDVHDRVEELRGAAVSHPTVYSAIDRLADAGLVHIGSINKRSKSVALTPAGVHLLFDAGERFAAAADGDYNEAKP